MLISFVLIFVAMLVAGVLLFSLLSNYTINDRKAKLVEEAERLNESTLFFISNKNTILESFYYMNLNDVSKRTNGVVYIIDKAGNFILSDNAHLHLYREKLNEGLVSNISSGEMYVSVGNMNGLYKTIHLTVGLPLVFEGDIVGATYIAVPLPEINRYKNEIFRISLLAISVAFAIASFVTYLYSRKVSKPLKEMMIAAEGVSKGDFNFRVSENGDGEISELSRSFNLMLDSLKNLEDMRAGFIANVSHELRTPMTTITGFIEGIIDKTIPDESREKYLKIVLDETKRLAKLVSELLQLARLDAGNLQLEIRRFNVNELVRRTLLSFETSICKLNINVNIDFEEEEIFVLADRDSISRVLTNLLDNALKFNCENGYIKLGVKTSGGKAVVFVENSGIGIEPEEINRIWDRFYKTDKSRGMDKKGVGLGLFLVKGIITGHGEKIWAESEKDKWTRFTFTLKKTY